MSSRRARPGRSLRAGFRCPGSTRSLGTGGEAPPFVLPRQRSETFRDPLLLARTLAWEQALVTEFAIELQEIGLNVRGMSNALSQWHADARKQAWRPRR